MASKRILLLGATGSIGDSAVRVVEDLGPELEICALASNTNWRKLLTLVERFHPESVALSDPKASDHRIAQTGRTHSRTRPACINLKTTLAKPGPSTHSQYAT